MATCGRCGAENTPEARFCNRCGTALPGATERDGRETRRVVTILFADLVGSTALSERLDPERWRAVQGRYFTALRDTIERHGGLVEKFIGDAVMAVFGLPAAHEDDALRAVRAAAELTPALSDLNNELRRSNGLGLRLRVGVNTGEVVAAEGGSGDAIASGDTVSTAARLEQSAEPGEVILELGTYSLVRDAVQAEALNPLDLRGKAGPTAAYRLIRVVGGEAHARRLDAPMVGRGSELDVLERSLERAIAGPSAELVTIVGTAGVGKSRLVRAFLDSAAGRARVARGRCLSYGDGITYWSIAEILRDLAGVDPASSREDAMALLAALVPPGLEGRDRIAGILESLVGESAVASAGDDIAWAVRRTLGALASANPLVLVVEDIHWAEPALLDLLEALLDWTTGARLLILCPARPELFDRRPDWGADRRNAVRLDLEPLDGADTRALLQALPGGGAVPATLQERILTAAEGNPLYIEEMLGKLIDDGALQSGPVGWAFAGPADAITVPATVSAMIAARIDGLERPERSAAERASVVGRVFERGAVATLSPATERDTLSGRLLALTRKQLILPDGSGLDGDDAFRFRHVLIRDAAYDRLSKAERAELHERFAAWLERVTGNRRAEYVEVLAHHLASAAEYRLELGTLIGQAGEELARAAVECLVEAAEHATRVFAHEEAARLYERASNLVVRGPTSSGPAADAVDLQSRRAEALHLAGDPQAAAYVVQAAINGLDGPAKLQAATMTERLATYLWDAGEEPGALEAAAGAVNFMPDEPPSAARALALATQARLLMLANHNDQALALCQPALDAARAAAAEPVLAGVLVTRATLIGRSEPRRGIAMLEDARRFAEGIDDVSQMLRADNNLCVLLFDLHDFERSREVTARAIATATEAGLERSAGMTFHRECRERGAVGVGAMPRDRGGRSRDRTRLDRRPYRVRLRRTGLCTDHDGRCSGGAR